MVNVHELSSIYVSLIWLDYVGLLKILVFVGSICWINLLVFVDDCDDWLDICWIMLVSGDL